MKPMVQGTEHEYTLYSDRLNPRGIDPHRLALELLWKSNLAAGGEFLKNSFFARCGSQKTWEKPPSAVPIFGPAAAGPRWATEARHA